MFTIWTTNYCNLQCKYCYEGNEKRKIFMDVTVADATIKWILGWLKDNRESETLIRFHGGEPTLNMPIIRHIITELNKYPEYKFDYELTTNGYCLNGEDIFFLTQHMNSLSVSMDGNQINNDQYRVTASGQGTFEKVFENALKMNELSDNVSVRMTIKPCQVKNMLENIMFFVRAGFKSIAIALDIWDDDWTMELLDEIELVYNELQQRLTQEEYDDVEINNVFSAELKKRKCEGGINGFQINADGNLYPCTYTVGDKEYVCGSVFKGIDKKQIKCFEKIYAMPIGACEGCTNYEGCISVRCKYINKKRMGELDIPISLLCAIEHKKIRNVYE